MSSPELYFWVECEWEVRWFIKDIWGGELWGRGVSWVIAGEEEEELLGIAFIYDFNGEKGGIYVYVKGDRDLEEHIWPSTEKYNIGVTRVVKCDVVGNGPEKAYSSWG